MELNEHAIRKIGWEAARYTLLLAAGGGRGALWGAFLAKLPPKATKAAGDVPLDQPGLAWSAAIPDRASSV
jgi:hypothetical protein